jgi:hypothetical protein
VCACVRVHACAFVFACACTHLENASTVENQHVINTNFCHVCPVMCWPHASTGHCILCQHIYEQVTGFLDFVHSLIQCFSTAGPLSSTGPLSYRNKNLPGRNLTEVENHCSNTLKTQKNTMFWSSGEGWETPTLLGLLERANLNHQTAYVSITTNT